MEPVIPILHELREKSDLSAEQRHTALFILFLLSSLKEEELFLTQCLRRLVDQEDLEKIQQDLSHYYQKYRNNTGLM